jgi:hypothetical protein
MSTTHSRPHKSIANAAVVATATGIAAFTFAAPASAERKTLVYQNDVVSHCRAADDCDMVQVGFAAETGTQTVRFSNIPNHPGNDCAKAVAEFYLDGQRLQSRLVGPNWEQPGFTINAAPGQHSLGIRIISQSDCKTGSAGDYDAGLWVYEDVTPAPPPPPPPSQQAPAPKQGPLVSAEPGALGVTFHVTDRSGVASQCTYSSEGYTDSFGLPANGSFDLFVPAIRLFKTRTGVITCDNGTSTNTSVFY